MKKIIALLLMMTMLFSSFSFSLAENADDAAKAEETVAEAAEKAEETVTETAEKAEEAVTEAAEKAADAPADES